MFRQALTNDKEKIIAFYDVAIEANNKAEINLRWKKDVHPSHRLLCSSVENGELFLWEENGEILAACIMNDFYNESYEKISWGIKASKKELGIIHVLAVAPQSLRKGIGEKLLTELINYAKSTTIKSIRLDVFKVNVPAIKLYEKVGFKCMGETVMFVPNIGEEKFCLFEYIIK